MSERIQPEKTAAENLEEWNRLSVEKEANQKLLRKKLKEVSRSLGFGDPDPDGNMRFKDWSDAIALQELAREQGLEVKIIEPSASAIKAKTWLAEYFVVSPEKLLD